jgi:hypothetical protein
MELRHGGGGNENQREQENVNQRFQKKTSDWVEFLEPIYSKQLTCQDEQNLKNLSGN